ncbi:MAG: hypothetical protein H0X31_06290 [Nostocaceae cyanobacterium]|nr:hypothetical protein [Nostocaceae cyanobacterium]
MNTSTSFGKNSESKVPHELREAYSQEIQTITEALVKITNLSSETVKPHLDTMLEQLVKSKGERPFYETATADEWIQALQEWSFSHRRDTPLLSDYAVSRAGIYEDEET